MLVGQGGLEPPRVASAAELQSGTLPFRHRPLSANEQIEPSMPPCTVALMYHILVVNCYSMRPLVTKPMRHLASSDLVSVARGAEAHGFFGPICFARLDAIVVGVTTSPTTCGWHLQLLLGFAFLLATRGFLALIDQSLGVGRALQIRGQDVDACYDLLGCVRVGHGLSFENKLLRLLIAVVLRSQTTSLAYYLTSGSNCFPRLEDRRPVIRGSTGHRNPSCC